MATRRARAKPGGLSETAPLEQPEGDAYAFGDAFNAATVDVLRMWKELRGTPAADDLLRNFHVHTKVQVLRRFVEAGSGKAVLAAVASCAEGGIAMPDWLAGAYLSRFRAVQEHRAATWDEAFGTAWHRSAKPTWLQRFDEMVEVHQLAMEVAKRSPDCKRGDFLAAFECGDDEWTAVPPDLYARIQALRFRKDKATKLLQWAFEIWPRPSFEDARAAALPPAKTRKR